MKPRAARSLLVALLIAVAGMALALCGRDDGRGDSRDDGRGDGRAVSRSDGPSRPEPSDTFVPSVRGQRAVLWAVGDGADGSRPGKAVAARIARSRMNRLLYLGDVYGGEPGAAGDGTAADYRDHYDPVYGKFAARTAPTPGNHEWPQHAQGYNPYWTKVHGPAPAYYAFTAGGWQILSLNSQAPHAADSPQLKWLRAQLGGGTCRLAFWHRPRFSAGSHGDQRDVAPLWNALRRRAALVVSGHEHDMQRFHPRDGITQLVSGAGGHGHYPVKTADPRLAFSNDRAYGALRITLRPGRSDLAFVTADGRVLDRHRVGCKAP